MIRKIMSAVCMILVILLLLPAITIVVDAQGVEVQAPPVQGSPPEPPPKGTEPPPEPPPEGTQPATERTPIELDMQMMVVLAAISVAVGVGLLFKNRLFQQRPD
ncbi:hypothetical protein MYX82_03190 [Acidobacteria bacterium AH-259-D05]|nr:hypothetical protein [Acidobacteria bacterium AH-259-D05]